MLPSGEILGNGDSRVIYTGDNSKRAAFQCAGSLVQWQKEIGCYLNGNSRLLLALSMVLVAPLLKLLQQESGGFHLFDCSSIGKSIAGMVAMSALGDPLRL